MLVGTVTARCSPRIDNDIAQFGALFLGNQQPLVQNRVTPRQVRASQDHQVGLFKVVVTVGNGIAAEGIARAATADDMHRRELVSMFAEPMKPFISLLAT